MRFEIYEGKDGKWYWRAVASNGNKTADGGQGYASKGNARGAVKAFVRQVKRADPPINTLPSKK